MMALKKKRKPKRRTTGVLFLRNLPLAVKTLFKGKTAGRGDTMQDAMEALMRLYIDNPRVVEQYIQDIKDRRTRKAGF